MSKGNTGWQSHDGAADSCAVNQSPSTASMPAAVQPALWQYNPESFRGYLQVGQCVGQWSDVVSIPVAG